MTMSEAEELVYDNVEDENVYNRLGKKPTKKFIVAGMWEGKGKLKKLITFLLSLKWIFYDSRLYSWPRFSTMSRCMDAVAKEVEPEDNWRVRPLDRIYAETGE